jgi:hypothetical protein
MNDPASDAGFLFAGQWLGRAAPEAFRDVFQRPFLFADICAVS